MTSYPWLRSLELNYNVCYTLDQRNTQEILNIRMGRRLFNLKQLQSPFSLESSIANLKKIDSVLNGNFWSLCLKSLGNTLKMLRWVGGPSYYINWQSCISSLANLANSWKIIPIVHVLSLDSNTLLWQRWMETFIKTLNAWKWSNSICWNVLKGIIFLFNPPEIFILSPQPC